MNQINYESQKNPCFLKFCPKGQVCNHETGECQTDVKPSFECAVNGCPKGKFCKLETGECILEKDCKECLKGQVCNKETGKCETPLEPNCNVIPCPEGKVCVKGKCETPLEPNCNVIPCLVGSKCETKTGKCIPENLCDNQKNFNHAFYDAIKYVRKKDDQKISPFLTMYLIIHFIFLFWGIVLAFKSQPPENRLVHITLAIVFAPAYVLAYYLNAF